LATPSFTVELLHGLRKGGACHRVVVLRDPTGYDEATMAEASDVTPVEQASRFLAGLIAKIGDCERPTPDEVLALSVGDRERLLLAVSARLLGHELQLVATCPHCREKAEIGARVADLIELPTPAPDEIDLEAEDGRWWARIRPPTGADLRRAARGTPDAARALLTDCLVELVDPAGQPAAATVLPAECEARLASALAELDRMAECSVEIACPTCQAPIEALIDGYTLLRAALGEADNLYREVLKMTRVYRWTEAEIMALPLIRRRRYLAAAGLEGAPS
jgi:hypothetical protein